MVMIRLGSTTAPTYKRQLLTLDFWDEVAVKLVATFISVKVWALIVTWILSSYFLCKGLLKGGDWVTINGTVTSVVMGMREIFKIASVRQYLDKESPDDEQPVGGQPKAGGQG